jgi:hypothetical protein
VLGHQDLLEVAAGLGDVGSAQVSATVLAAVEAFEVVVATDRTDH